MPSSSMDDAGDDVPDTINTGTFRNVVVLVSSCGCWVNVIEALGLVSAGMVVYYSLWDLVLEPWVSQVRCWGKVRKIPTG
jgi:hypothetical protein